MTLRPIVNVCLYHIFTFILFLYHPVFRGQEILHHTSHWYTGSNRFFVFFVQKSIFLAVVHLSIIAHCPTSLATTAGWTRREACGSCVSGFNRKGVAAAIPDNVKSYPNPQKTCQEFSNWAALSEASKHTSQPVFKQMFENGDFQACAK